MSTLPSQTLCARRGASNPLSSVSRDWSRTFSRPWAGGAAGGSRGLLRLRHTSPSSLIRNSTSRVAPDGLGAAPLPRHGRVRRAHVDDLRTALQEGRHHGELL